MCDMGEGVPTTINDVVLFLMSDKEFGDREEAVSKQGVVRSVGLEYQNETDSSKRSTKRDVGTRCVFIMLMRLVSVGSCTRTFCRFGSEICFFP